MPFSIFQKLVSYKVLQENNLINGRKTMDYAKIGVPQFDGNNYAF
jgi:hypothetical protein